MLEALAREGSTPEEVASPELMRRVWEFEHQVHELHVRPLLEDEGMRYGRDMAAAVRALVGSFPPRPRVLVVGLGTGVAAVAAARAGADVVWLEAVARHCAVAEELAAKNGVDVAVERHVGERASEWAGGAFDAVVVEPVGDWLADGRLAECALAARRWLKPGGRFLPRAATVSVVLASVRTGTVSGFDMDAFDDFRSNAMLCYGPSDVRHDVLSAPATLRIDFEAVARGRGDADWAARAELAVSEESAVFNASVFWATVDLVDGVAPRAFAPRLDLNGPRARCEGLSYVGAEHAVRRGDRVPADLRYDGYKFSVAVRCADEPLKTYRGEPVLGYHFPMLNDDTRNAAFERAIARAIAAWKREHPGRSPHVLDVGGGAGLLAMMAARHGAGRVTSLEMVPALARAAERVVRANDLEHVITVVEAKSTEATFSANALYAKHRGQIYGADKCCDLVVAEIVDCKLLGEGVVPALADARDRLLPPGAPVVPRRGAIWATAVELRPATRLAEALAEATGEPWNLDALNVFHHDGAVCAITAMGTRLHKRPYAVELSEPVKLFDFDFSRDPADFARRRKVELPCRRRGVLNGVVLHFDLDVDDGDRLSSGAGGDANGAWDQLVRYLPVEVRVDRGDAIPLYAEHVSDDVFLYLRAKALGPNAIDVENVVGHVDLPGERTHAVCVANAD